MFTLNWPLRQRAGFTLRLRIGVRANAIDAAGLPPAFVRLRAGAGMGVRRLEPADDTPVGS